MAETVTNTAKNSATPTQQAFSSASKTWADMTGTWGDGAGTWQNPYTMDNDDRNNGTITNQAQT